MNKNIIESVGFGEYVKLAEQGLCPFCRKEVGAYRDELSEKEGRISGLCQSCQDQIFKS